LVLEFGVLENLEIESSRRVPSERTLDAFWFHALRQQAVDERGTRPRNVGHTVNREFGQNEKADAGEKIALQAI